MVRKQVKTQEKKNTRFNWPTFVHYEGHQVICYEKNPNFAKYLLPGAFMNRSIILDRDTWIRHQNNHGMLHE